LATESEAPAAALVGKHTPLIEKQPFVKSMPFAKVEEAVCDVALTILAERPAPNVDVAFPEIVVVAVPLPA